MSDEPPFHNPFGALRAMKDRLPPAPERAPERVKAEPVSAPAGRYPRAVVRIERSGRGGKEVTVIEQLGLAERDRDEWLKALKSALGCGGAVQGDSLVLQGDQRKRLPELLAARGVRRVIVAT